MINFYLSKSVESNYIALNDITVKLNSLRLSINNEKKPDIYTLPFSSFRDSLWIKKGIADIGIFTDANGVNGIAVFNSSVIDLYYTREKQVQIIENIKGLVSINFTNLNSKLFIDSEVIDKYSPILSGLSIYNIEYIADNGIIFKVNSKLYTLIF